jgi:DNA-binding Xre family transcriptional regulator
MPLNLKNLRKWVDSCDSTADAARRIGMKRENLIRLLNGEKANIRFETLVKIADAMDVNLPPELFTRATVV